jgi:hypothetical protein
VLFRSPLPDKSRALHGVSEPLPASLKFLDDQGGWFNPFTHPGMLPPYDPRGWHALPAPTKKRLDRTRLSVSSSPR